MLRESGTLLVVFLFVSVAAAIWAIQRHAETHRQTRQSVVVIDDLLLQNEAVAVNCNRTGGADFDVSDYSFNVVTEATKPEMYRYLTNTDTPSLVNVHVLSTHGGDAHVAVAATEKPVWLVLLASRDTDWHIEQAEGAKVERILASQTVNELRLTESFITERDSILDFFIGGIPTTVAATSIDVLGTAKCLTSLSGFQRYQDLHAFVPAIRNLRASLGHVEHSFQSPVDPTPGESSFQVPFVIPAVSSQQLADIEKLKWPPRKKAEDIVVRQTPSTPDQVTQYENMVRRSDIQPVTFDDTKEFLRTLASYQGKGLLPRAMPASVRNAGGVSTEWYSLDSYESAFIRKVQSGVTDDACSNSRDREVLIIEGNNSSNIVKCAWGKQLYFMRGGNDHVDDSWGDDIFYPGPGDDVIEAGWDNDLVFLNYGWGADIVDKTCHNASYRPQDAAAAGDTDWSRSWPFKSFIVFGKDIAKSDIIRINNKLVHKQTGDSVTLRGDCFNTVFWQ